MATIKENNEAVTAIIKQVEADIESLEIDILNQWDKAKRDNNLGIDTTIAFQIRDQARLTVLKEMKRVLEDNTSIAAKIGELNTCYENAIQSSSVFRQSTSQVENLINNAIANAWHYEWKRSHIHQGLHQRSGSLPLNRIRYQQD